jgi:hypothetical protein
LHLSSLMVTPAGESKACGFEGGFGAVRSVV